MYATGRCVCGRTGDAWIGNTARLSQTGDFAAPRAPQQRDRQCDNSLMPASLRGGGRLTRDSIVAAAITMIESQGVDALTMRKLANACGAAPMSLYRYIATKEELLRAVVDAYLADVDLPPTDDLPWHEAIEQVVLAVAAGFDAHTHFAEILAIQPIDAAAVLDGMERIARALRSAGFDDDAVRSGLATLSAFATGYVHRRAEIVARRRSTPTVSAASQKSRIAFRLCYRSQQGMPSTLRRTSARVSHASLTPCASSFRERGDGSGCDDVTSALARQSSAPRHGRNREAPARRPDSELVQGLMADLSCSTSLYFWTLPVAVTGRSSAR